MTLKGQQDKTVNSVSFNVKKKKKEPEVNVNPNRHVKADMPDDARIAKIK